MIYIAYLAEQTGLSYFMVILMMMGGLFPSVPLLPPGGF